MKRSSVGGYGQVYDLLIPKLCKGGNFEKGRELWEEALSIDVTLSCSISLLDPSVTEVFKPMKMKEEAAMVDRRALNLKIHARMNKTKPKLKLKPKRRSKTKKKNLQH
jgi:pentatricopeptide repeat protein